MRIGKAPAARRTLISVFAKPGLSAKIDLAHVDPSIAVTPAGRCASLLSPQLLTCGSMNLKRFHLTGRSF
ncbi:MAG: hypothetical protein ACRDRV_01005 [Pseudonocardiaceae bacterium]